MWKFGCKMGLAQGTCGEYVEDAEARGYGRLGGCPSCVHRQPADEQTEEVEAYYSRYQAVKDL